DNGDTSSSLSGTLSFSTSATTSSDMGNYNVTPSGLTSSNYAITFVAGTLQVTQAALTVTADNKSKAYGAALPAFTASYSGFVLGQDESVLGGTLGSTTSATASSNVGHYSVTPGGLTSSNYAISFVAGDLNVTPAGLTVTTHDASKVYGDPLPTFSVT